MTPTNLIRAIKSTSPAQNVAIQQNLDHPTASQKTNTIHTIISLKPFTYKNKKPQEKQLCHRKGKDSYNSRQLLWWKCLEIKRVPRAASLQLQHLAWCFQTASTRKREWAGWETTSWTRDPSNCKHQKMFKTRTNQNIIKQNNLKRQLLSIW